MSKAMLTKSLAILLNLALVGTSFADMGVPGAAASAAAMPDFVKALTPPEQLGYITDSYQGQTDKPVVLIQDLHANYGVQKKIESLLEFLQPKVSPNGQPMVLGIEGAWGKLDLTKIRNVPEKPRLAASNFLLKEAEISGMEHYAALTPDPIEFYGIDNPEDYIMHVNLFRKSLAARLELAGKIDKLRESVNQAKADGSAALRRLWKLSDEFHAGKIGLDELSHALNTPLSNYGQAEAALASAENDAADHAKGDKAFYLKNVVAADQDLELLARLFRQQLTMEEVQYVAGRVPQMLVVIQALIPGENMQLWEDTVRSAIDHYAVALLRNQPLSAHAEELAANHPASSVVIVTGGFHTAGIMEDLKIKKMSYVVIAPVVESESAQDERLYIKRMMGIHVTQPEISSAVQAYASARTVPGIELYSAAGESETNGATPEIAKDAKLAGDVNTAFANGANAADIGRTLEGASPVGAVAMAGAIDENVQDPVIKTPLSLFARGKALLTTFLQRVGVMKPIEVAADSQARNAADVTLGGQEATTQTTAAPAKSGGILRRVVTVTTALTLGAVNLMGQSGHQFQQVAQTHASSSPLTWALGIGATAVGAVVAYRNREKIQQGLIEMRGRIAEAGAA